MDFYIKSITAHASMPGRTDSTVEFSPGLNLITGASDTGKTAVLRCIKFMFGGDKPFDSKAKGFNKVTMVLNTMKGEITLSRTIGKNKLMVEHEIPGLPSGWFGAAYNDKKEDAPPGISRFWFSLYGIPGDPMIIWRMVGNRKHLTMKTVLRTFYLDEHDIDSTESVLLPVEKSTHVHFLAALLYFLVGDDFPEQKLFDTDSISKARRDAVEKFANDRIKALSDQRDEKEKALEKYKGMNIEAALEQSIVQLTRTEQSLQSAMNRRRELLETIKHLENEEAELVLVLSRDRELETQYQSDISRLVFITESEKLVNQRRPSDTCPFCNSRIQPITRPSYIQSNRAELHKIVREAQGLAESSLDVEKKLLGIREQIEALQAESEKIRVQISEQLKPLAAHLRENIKDYRSYIQLKNSYDLLHEVSSGIQTTLDSPEYQVKKPDTEFRPREHFPAGFEPDMSKVAMEILTQVNYRGLNVTRFLMQPFDLLINGVTKQEEHGKGYNSFINTVLGLTMRRYFIDKSKYKPGLFIVDTPLHGFDEGQVISDTSMIHGLFEYLISQGSTGQMIVVENDKSVPKDIDFEGRGVQVIDFHKGIYTSRFKNSRYGFLIGVTGR